MIDEAPLIPETAPSIADHILRQLRERGGLTAVLSTTGPALARVYGSTEAVWAVRDVTRARGFLWICSVEPDASKRPGAYSEPPSATMARYFTGPSGDWLLTRQGNDTRSRSWRLWLQGTGYVVASAELIRHAALLAHGRPLTRLLSVQIPPVGDFTGRFLLINPSDGDMDSTVSSVATLARQVGPSMLAKHENRLLRMQVRSEERALLARELHDGVIQSLLGLGIRLHVLGHGASVAGSARDALAAIERQIHEQVVSLRQLTENLRPMDLQPSQLSKYVARVTEGFQREAGIAVTLQAELGDIPFLPSMCVEMLRVLQEALVNIRRHSGARSVHVALSAHPGYCVMEISDDGRGFPFTGRLTLDDLDRTLQGPRVIMERVRALGGTLTIESGSPGARLEIRFPMSTGYAVA